MAEEALYQLEVKLPSGENGETRTQVIKVKGAEQIWYSNREEFPEQGNTLMLYISVDTKKSYIWDSAAKQYALLGSEEELFKLLDTKVGRDEFAAHTHTITLQGFLSEEIVGDMEATITTVKEIEEVGTLPEWGYTYKDGVMTLSWNQGTLPTVRTRTVVESIKVTKTKAGFEVSGVSGFADNTKAEEVLNRAVANALDGSY